MKDNSWSKFLKVVAVFLISVIVYIFLEYVLVKFFATKVEAAQVIGIVLAMVNMLVTGFAAGIGFYIAKQMFEH